MKKINKAELAAVLRMTKRSLDLLRDAGKIPPPDGAGYRGELFWLLTPELKKIIKAQRRPER